jgi:hypothetical protein
MYNTEILEKIVDEFGKEKATEFCNIVSVMYDIKYNACKNKSGLCEYDYERDWWNNAYVELKKDEQS